MRYKDMNSRKINGVVYTPFEIADYISLEMIKYIKNINSNIIKILDPAAGNGNLLISMVNAVKNISNAKIKAVGYEIDEDTCKYTMNRLRKLFPDIVIDIINEDFLDVAEKGIREKYDFVIANPPYLRTQIIGSEKAEKIAEKLKIAGKIDIYYAFLIYAERILKDDGIAGFITSNKFLTIKSGTAIRNYMLDNYFMYRIIDLGDTKVFDASVLPCIVIFSKGKTLDNQNVKFTSIYEVQNDLLAKYVKNISEMIDETGLCETKDGKKYIVKQGKLRKACKNELWNIISSEDEKWMISVEQRTYKFFGDIGKIRVGIKTTADKIFIGDDWNGDKAKIECLRPLITHRNAGQIISYSEKLWKVLYTHYILDGKRTAIDLDEYPYTKKYLESHYGELSARKYLQKANRNWYEIWVPQNPDSWQDRKIVFRDIADEPQFWLDDTGAVVNGDCYWIDIFPDVSDDIIYLALAVANSKFIEKYYDINFNTKLYSGKRRYMSQYVEKFPIPLPDTNSAKQIIRIMKKIIKENTRKSILLYKNRLNELVEKCFFV